MREQSELTSRVIELEKLVKSQASQIEGLKQSINILINIVATDLEPNEDGAEFGPEGPTGPGLSPNN